MALHGQGSAMTELQSSVPTVFTKGARILFQGDSITDCGRDRASRTANTTAELGNGYPLLVAAGLLRKYPALRLEVMNRGIGGNRVPDLLSRWNADTIDLKPDIVSILVGVNDYWHRKKHGYNGTNADYAAEYRQLVQSTRAALPSTTLIILEPFVLRTGEIDGTWFPAFDEVRAIAAQIAEEAHATFVPVQATLSALAETTGPEYWTADGVHPTLAGHALLADLWRTAVGV